MKRVWWKEGVVYQIYPRSFMDSNGDGIGDLKGITEKLDYLEELGITIVWLNPVYASPNDDNGYDISDYRAIMAEFGTMTDWEELLSGLHQRGIRLIMDLVVNHTSDEHAWFTESRASRDNPRRDYYIWRPGQGGKEPNNWLSFFGGSAWQYDEATGEYYLHLFSKKQPDLNWENRKVREEVFDLMRFWLDKGIDGFRMDVINLISKVPGLPDAGPADLSGYGWGGDFFCNGPRIHEYLQAMNREVLSHYDAMTVGECVDISPQQALLYAGDARHELNMVFQMEHMDLDAVPGQGKFSSAPWRLSRLKEVLGRWQQSLEGKGWNSLFWMNHDQPRAVSRFGNDGEFRTEAAKLLATALFTLQGTPFIYQGEEIGMTNVAFDSIEDYRDIESLNYYKTREKQGADMSKVLAAIQNKSRDNSRTPMQWNSSENAGFTQGVPWIKVNPNFTKINVEAARKDESSVFHYYKALIRLRGQHLDLVYGKYTPFAAEHERVYAYFRQGENAEYFIMLNFSRDSAAFALPGSMNLKQWKQLLSNYPVGGNSRSFLKAELLLRPYEAVIMEKRD